MENKSEKAKKIAKTVVKIAQTIATVGPVILTAIGDKNKGKK